MIKTQGKLRSASASWLPAILMSLVSCGVDPGTTDSQDTRTARTDAANSKTADASGKAAGADGESEAAGEDTECLTLWLHAGHCEANDDVSDGETQKDDQDGDQGDDQGDDQGADQDSGDEPADDDDKPVTPPPPVTPPEDPNVVVFRIKAGTGSAPWNTAQEIVQVKVGQTLRIINDDTINHRLHTGGAPCNHGTAFAPGAAFNCVVSKAFDSSVTPGGLYDHVAGPTARFYVKASP